MKDIDKTNNKLISEPEELPLQVPIPSPSRNISRETFSFLGSLPEDFYRDFLENTHDLIQTITPDGRFLYVNDAWLKTLGYDRKEIQNLSLKDIIHPDCHGHCGNFLEVLKTDMPLDIFQTELITRWKKKIVVEASVHAHYVEKEPVFIQCILRDITERKKAEESLQKLEALESSLLAAIPHAVVGLRERTIMFANEAVEKVFGWKPDELLNKPTRVFYRNDEEYEEIGRHFYPLLETRKTYSENFPCRHKDGRDILCRVSASVIGRKLEHREIVVIYEDITERERFEKALQESEKKYADFYQNAPDGYHSLGPDGMILEVNNTWLRMFGYTRDEIVGKERLTSLLDEEGIQIFQKTFHRLKETGSIDNIQYMIRRKDGLRIPVLLSASAIYDEKGNFVKTRTIVRDISARIGFRNMLEQALEEWRVTFDSMPCGVLLLDMDFTIVRANRYIASLYDLSFKELKERRCFELIRSERLEESYFGIRSQSRLSIRPFEYSEKTMGRHFMLSLTPIPDSSGVTKAFVLTMVDITDLKDKQKKLSESKEAFFNMLKELDFSYRELRELHDGLIHSFVNAIDAKSPWTKGHSERVTNYALAIGASMGLESEDMHILRNASLLHDIGKIGTYDVILDNPKRLTPEEHNLINLHPEKGEAILRPIKQLQNVLPIIRHHHEQIDGSGYPDGLKGDEIPLFARILCVADSFDSMTSDRPYRPGRDKKYAISEMKICSGTQFDPAVVRAFLDIIDEIQIPRKTL